MSLMAKCYKTIAEMES